MKKIKSQDLLSQVRKLSELSKEDIEGFQDLDEIEQIFIEDIIEQLKKSYSAILSIPNGYKRVPILAKELDVSRQTIHKSNRFHKIKTEDGTIYAIKKD